MSTAPLPAGFGLALDRRTRRHRAGRVLSGGAAGRIVALSAAGRDALEGLLGDTGERAATGAAAASPAALALARRLVDAGLAHPRPPAPVAAPDVTIVIPVRDRVVALDTLLGALGRAHPVVVVDDGSADPAAVRAACARHGAGLLTRPVNGGPAAARNTALEAITTDLVAFVDSDCLPPPGWIAALVPHFADPLVGAVAPRVRPRSAVAHTGGRPSWRERYATARSPLDLGADEARVGPGRPVAYIPTAALLLRRAALPGGFDPALRVGEDVDAVWRMDDGGWTVRYDPSVTVVHDEPRSWRGLLARRLRYGTSAAPLARRHPGRLAPVGLRPWPTAVVVAALAGRPRTTLGLAALSAVALARRAGAGGLPAAQAPRLAARATLQTAIGLSRAAATLAGPLLLLALGRRRLRRPALALLLLAPLARWLADRPPLDPVRWTVGHLADDAAYGAGVWIGCLRERTAAPLRPAMRRGRASG